MFHVILLYVDHISVDFKWLIKTQTVTVRSGVLSKPSGPETWIYSSIAGVC